MIVLFEVTVIIAGRWRAFVCVLISKDLVRYRMFIGFEGFYVCAEDVYEILYVSYSTCAVALFYI